MALADQANLVLTMSLKDGISSGLKGIQSGMSGLDKSFGRTQASLGKLGNNLKNVALIGVGSLVGGFALAIREASSFESQLNTINTVAKLSADDLTAVGESLRDLAMNAGKPVEELTAAYYDLVSAGVQAADAQGVLERATTLATGGLGTTSETVNLLTTAMNSYGLTAEEVADATDMFAQAIGAGKVTASELASSFATIGPVAASAGVELEEVAAAYAQMTASGIPAAEAATAMRSAITALQTPNANLLAMQKKLNVNFADVSEEEGLAAAYQMIVEEADKQGLSLMSLTGNVNANAYALSVSGENAEGFAANLEAVRSSTDGAGVAAEQAAERQKGLSFQLDKLKVIGQDVAIMFGQEMLPSVTRIVDKLGELIELNYEKLERLAGNVGDALDSAFSDQNLTDGIGTLSRKIGNLLDSLGTADLKDGLKGALDFLKNMPWDTIAGGLKITGEAAKLVIDTFRSLPPDIQKVLIGALAMNKVTGGLLTSVAHDLAGIALKSLTTINAANVTVVGTNVTGGGGVAGVPGGTSKVGNVVNSLPLIGIGAMGAAIINEQGESAAAHIREFPITTETADGLTKTNLVPLLQLGNDPFAQLITGIAGTGFQHTILEIGNLGDEVASFGGRQIAEQQRASLVSSEIRDRLGTTNTNLGTLTQIGADHRMAFQQIYAQEQEQKRLALIGNFAASEANARLSAIQISSQRTAQKDFSMSVTVHTNLNVSGERIAANIARIERIGGFTDY